VLQFIIILQDKESQFRKCGIRKWKFTTM